MFWADDSMCAASAAQQARYELALERAPRPADTAPTLPAGLLADRRKAVEQAAPRRRRLSIMVLRPET